MVNVSGSVNARHLDSHFELLLRLSRDICKYDICFIRDWYYPYICSSLVTNHFLPHEYSQQI
jgi:hypothetical protein